MPLMIICLETWQLCLEAVKLLAEQCVRFQQPLAEQYAKGEGKASLFCNGHSKSDLNMLNLGEWDTLKDYCCAKVVGFTSGIPGT